MRPRSGPRALPKCGGGGGGGGGGGLDPPSCGAPLEGARPPAAAAPRRCAATRRDRCHPPSAPSLRRYDTRSRSSLSSWTSFVQGRRGRRSRDQTRSDEHSSGREGREPPEGRESPEESAGSYEPILYKSRSGRGTEKVDQGGARRETLPTWQRFCRAAPGAARARRAETFPSGNERTRSQPQPQPTTL